MQALSQLSYGPTMLDAEFYADVKSSPSVFCMRDTCATQTKSPDRSQGFVL